MWMLVGALGCPKPPPEAAPSAPPAIWTATYAGSFDHAGHLDRPRDQRRYHATLQVRSEPGVAWSAQMTLRDDADADPMHVETLVGDTSGSWIRSGDGPWDAVAPDALDHHQHEILAMTLGHGGPLVCDADACQGTSTWPHPRFGDVEQTVDLTWDTPDRSGAPRQIRISPLAADVVNLLDVTAVVDIPLGPIAIPDGIPDAIPAATDPLSLVPVAPGVAALEIPQSDSRALVVAFDDHLVVCEAPLTSSIGEAMVDLLAEAYPDKPVRYVLFGHHHPHYTGGLRAFVAAGATVVTTPGNRDWVEEIAARSFTLAPDRLAALGDTAPPLDIVTFDTTWTHEDETNALVALDIGEDSHHTAEYIVFHLPRAEMVFQGDLGWFPGPDGPRPSGRARGLLAGLERLGVTDVAHLTQSWPLGAEALERQALVDLLPPLPE